MKLHGARHRTGFTLVELLVVIAIIALLIAVLMPALARARVVSRRTVALSNLRQLGVGLNAYAQVNGDAFPTLSQHEEKGFLGLSVLARLHQITEKAFLNPATEDQPASVRTSDDRLVLADLDGVEIDDATMIDAGNIEQVNFHCSYSFDNDIKRHKTGRSLVAAGDRADYKLGKTFSGNWKGEGMCLVWTDSHAEFTRFNYIWDQSDPNMYHHNELNGEGGDEVNDGVRVTPGTLDTHMRFFSEDEDDALLPN